MVALNIYNTFYGSSAVYRGVGQAKAVIFAIILAIKNGIVPPTIGLTDPDPECDLDYTPNTARKSDHTSAMANTLGFGGHNATVALRKW